MVPLVMSLFANFFHSTSSRAPCIESVKALSGSNLPWLPLGCEYHSQEYPLSDWNSSCFNNLSRVFLIQPSDAASNTTLEGNDDLIITPSFLDATTPWGRSV